LFCKFLQFGFFKKLGVIDSDQTIGDFQKNGNLKYKSCLQLLEQVLIKGDKDENSRWNNNSMFSFCDNSLWAVAAWKIL